MILIFYEIKCHAMLVAIVKTRLARNHWKDKGRVSRRNRCKQKCPIAISNLNLFWRSNFTFSQVFRDQNVEPVQSGHFNATHWELQKRNLHQCLDLTPASGEIAIIISWHCISNIWIVWWKDRSGMRIHGQLLQHVHCLCMLWQVQGPLFKRVPDVSDFEEYTCNQRQILQLAST